MLSAISVGSYPPTHPLIGPTKKWAFAHWCASTILALRHNSFRYQLYAAHMENTNRDASRQRGEDRFSNRSEPCHKPRRAARVGTTRLTPPQIRKCLK